MEPTDLSMKGGHCRPRKSAFVPVPQHPPPAPQPPPPLPPPLGLAAAFPPYHRQIPIPGAGGPHPHHPHAHPHDLLAASAAVAASTLLHHQSHSIEAQRQNESSPEEGKGRTCCGSCLLASSGRRSTNFCSAHNEVNCREQTYSCKAIMQKLQQNAPSPTSILVPDRSWLLSLNILKNRYIQNSS